MSKKRPSLSVQVIFCVRRIVNLFRRWLVIYQSKFAENHSLQVFQVTNGQYLCRDKYYGRGLSADGFKRTLRQFLHNGREPVLDVIPPMVVRLQKLRRELASLGTFRFYASSVLLSYEGAVDVACLKESAGESQNFSNSSNKNCPPERDVGVHMIDFAHSTYEGFLDDKTIYHGPDNDCLIALDNLVSLLQDIQHLP